MSGEQATGRVLVVDDDRVNRIAADAKPGT
jgi:hypothetical protein